MFLFHLFFGFLHLVFEAPKNYGARYYYYQQYQGVRYKQIRSLAISNEHQCTVLPNGITGVASLVALSCAKFRIVKPYSEPNQNRYNPEKQYFNVPEFLFTKFFPEVIRCLAKIRNKGGSFNIVKIIPMKIDFIMVSTLSEPTKSLEMQH